MMPEERVFPPRRGAGGAGEEMKLGPYLVPYTHTDTHTNSWIKDLDVKAKLIKFLESKTGKYLYDLLVEKNFLSKSQKSTSP